MLDPRIYRTGLVVVALAVIVGAFSLEDTSGPLGTTLAPDAFNGQNAYATMTRLAAAYPNRRPGSFGDEALASVVSRQLRRDGFVVHTSLFRGRTVEGTRTLEDVIGTRAGVSASGSIVVVTHRDALGSPAAPELSGTAVLLELARVLAGETHQRTIVLASTSGSAGGAGIVDLVRRLAQPIDAVLVLGDLAAAHVRGPVVLPWSNDRVLAPVVLRRTVASALSAQAGLTAGNTSLAAQFVHVAFPIAVAGQWPFAARGLPAVTLSLTGGRTPAGDEQTSEARITGLGRTVLQSLSALDGGPSLPAPTAYLLYDNKLIPAWAVRLLVLALIIPVLGATIDGVARARRRGHRVVAWIAWVLVSAIPFVLALLVVLGAKLVGLIAAAPPGPVASGAVRLHDGALVALCLVVAVLLGTFALLHRVAARRIMRAAGRPRGRRIRGVEGSHEGAAAAVLLILCVVSTAIWVTNPFAAVLLIPALHLWMWVVAPDVRLRLGVVVALLILGLAPIVLAAVYYSLSLGAGPVATVWNGVLLLAGGAVGPLVAVEWSVVLGCVISVLALAWSAARAPRPAEAPVTVRGPISYAGPGSLGGTESALRR